MPLITSADAPTFRLDDLEVVGFAAPSRGSSELSMWRLTLAPGAVGVAHSMDREEVFVALAGAAELTVGAARHELRAGSAFVVPAGTVFALANPHDAPFEAAAAMPVGALATLPGGEPFAPPWAE
jgi:quercetin dioxygenase-like cupin family protein